MRLIFPIINGPNISVSNVESVAWISHKWLILQESRSFSKLRFKSGYLWRQIQKFATPTFVSLSSASCFAESLLDPISSDLQQSSDSLVNEMKY